MPKINGQFVDKSTLMGGTGSSDSINTVMEAGTDPNRELKTTMAALMIANPKKYNVLEAIYEKMKLPEETETEKKARQSKDAAQRIVTQLEDMYLGNKLHYGNNIKGFYGDSLQPMVDPNAAASRYKAFLDSARPYLAKVAGDTGNVAWQEQLQAGKPFPTTRFDKKTAIQNFIEIRKKFGLPQRKYGSVNPDSGMGDMTSGEPDINSLSVKALGAQFGGK